ncbi:aspartate/glutamate racemase family protein [Granulicella sibirica]|uniref:Aspartate racemase n=1 Tax=Granulicella sibirica TaxID=2479048 RepID=A0A4Q0SZV4_9BACT|nr:aspartate/glutamate racemase family protein [Granulicella sibirica]RXH55059.1 Aspartate racemase [Granulicella sibirica]
MAAIGLVGGLGPAATVFYYRELLRMLKAAKLAPAIFIAHANVSYVLEAIAGDRLEEVAGYLGGLLASLEVAGAGITAITAVGPHIAAQYLSPSKARRIDLIETMLAAIEELGVRRIALLGPKKVVETALFGRLDRFEVVMPHASVIERLHELYFGIVRDEAAPASVVNELEEIALGLHDCGAEAVVLAGTELSLAFDPARERGFPVLDAGRLHIDAIVRALRVAEE